MRASEVLKSAVAVRHAHLDERVRAVLTSSADGCRAFLLASRAVVVPWERELRRFDWPAELCIEERLCKSDWLAHDFGAFPERDGAIAHAANPSEAWGALYVFEGATLGSTVIARIVDGTEFRYLRGYGDQTHTMWEQMKLSLDRAIAEGDELASCVATAGRVFAQFEEALD